MAENRVVIRHAHCRTELIAACRSTRTQTPIDTRMHREGTIHSFHPSMVVLKRPATANAINEAFNDVSKSAAVSPPADDYKQRNDGGYHAAAYMALYSRSQKQADQ